jgi:hypothetical protein
MNFSMLIVVGTDPESLAARGTNVILFSSMKSTVNLKLYLFIFFFFEIRKEKYINSYKDSTLILMKIPSNLSTF